MYLLVFFRIETPIFGNLSKVRAVRFRRGVQAKWVAIDALFIDVPDGKVVFNGLCNLGIVRRDDLCTVVPIYFIPVVFLWVVRCPVLTCTS